jgi:hypothetical protein
MERVEAGARASAGTGALACVCPVPCFVDSRVQVGYWLSVC